MSLIITGASGQLGRRAAELLLDTDGIDSADVVLVSRSTATLADLADRGAQVRFGDFSQPESLADAFAGADRVLLVSTSSLGAARVAEHRAAIDAARAAGARLIAYTSVPNPDPDLNPTFVVPDHAATEQALRDSGVAYAFLRNALYAELKVPEAQGAIASGTLTFNTSDGATTFVSREDCAAAAAAVLAGGDEHSNRVYTITGTELFSGRDLAALYAELGATEVNAESVDDDAFAAGLREHGVPAEGIEALTSFGQAIRAGVFDQLTDDVQRITGRAPRSLRETLVAAGIGRG